MASTKKRNKDINPSIGLLLSIPASCSSSLKDAWTRSPHTITAHFRVTIIIYVQQPDRRSEEEGTFKDPTSIHSFSRCLKYVIRTIHNLNIFRANSEGSSIETLEDDTRRPALGDLLHRLAIIGSLDSIHYIILIREATGFQL